MFLTEGLSKVILIPHDFTRYIYKNKNYNAKSNPKLTYEKANAIVKNFIEEDVNRINLLK